MDGNIRDYTDFLDMYQVSLVENFLRKAKIQNYKLYGGYAEAERKILIIYPEKFDDNMLQKNYNKILKIYTDLIKERKNV